MKNNVIASGSFIGTNCSVESSGLSKVTSALVLERNVAVDFSNLNVLN